MKNLFKVLIAVIPLIINLMKGIKKAKNEKEKQEFLTALKDGDFDTLNRLLFK